MNIIFPQTFTSTTIKTKQNKKINRDCFKICLHPEKCPSLSLDNSSYFANSIHIIGGQLSQKWPMYTFIQIRRQQTTKMNQCMTELLHSRHPKIGLFMILQIISYASGSLSIQGKRVERIMLKIRIWARVYTPKFDCTFTVTVRYNQLDCNCPTIAVRGFPCVNVVLSG